MIKCPHCDFTEDSEKFYYTYEEQGRLYTCINCNNSFLFVPKERIDYMSICESCGRHILKNASHWRGPYILCFTCVVPFDVKYKENNHHEIEERK
jgi:hypothetical protein